MNESFANEMPGVSSLARERRVPFRSWQLLAFLIIVHTSCWMDRTLLIILNEPIKRDLHLSDTQLGLISGFGFSLIYSFAALPIGRMVDRGSRPLILSSVIGIFGAATMVASLARGFFSLAATRMVVAAAESGLSPTAYSMISDAFPPRWRGRAVSLYSLGIAMGTWAGLTLGGMFNDMVGWRATFMLAGLPGVMLALIAGLWLRDPVRGGFDDGVEEPQSFSFGEAMRFILRGRAFIASALALGLLTITTGAFEGWVPAYMIRERGMNAATAGMLTGTVTGVGGIASTVLVGILADLLGRRDMRWYLWIPLIGTGIFIPAQILFFHSQGPSSYAFYIIAIIGDASYTGPLFALGQTLLPPRIRALGAAVMLLTINLIGMGGGMLGTGMISDLLHNRGSADSLAEALQILQGGAVLGAVALFYAAIWVKRDVAALR
jgi:predicted MFS family arabinose efflux permease